MSPVKMTCGMLVNDYYCVMGYRELHLSTPGRVRVYMQ